MRIGIVKWFNEQTGIGMIEASYDGRRVAIVRSVLSPDQILAPGQTVEFEPDPATNGARALRVQIVPDWLIAPTYNAA